MKSTAPYISRSKWMILALLALVALLSVFPALAEEDLPIATLELELYQCGGLPKETSRGSQYALMSDGVDFETHIVSQLKTQAEEIDVKDYQIPETELSGLFSDILNNHPNLFYVSNQWGYTVSNGFAYSILPKYKYSGAELQSRINRYNSELSRIVSYASSANSTLGKILLVNDYFCVNYQYEKSKPYSRYGADDLFIDKQGVCQAYMMGFRAAMDSLGIPCVPATTPPDGLNHTWNMVKLGGNWYHIDVTWNDPTSDMPYRACHNNFLLSDSGIRGTGHYGWTSTASAGSSTYDNFFWREVNTPMPVSGNSIYYVVQSDNSPTRFVKYWDGRDGEICSFTIENNSYYKGYYPVQLVGNWLCYATTNSLYLYDPAKQEHFNIYTVDDSNDYIMTAYYSDGQVHLYLKGSTNGVVSVPIPLLPTIALSEKQLLMEVEQSAPLIAMVENFADAPVVTWQSKDETIAEVDEQGLVTAKKPGVTAITAVCGNLSDTCEVLVYQFTFDDLNGQKLPQGHTYMTPPIAQPAEVFGEAEAGWRVESTAPKVARVNADGSFTTLTGGEATITVQSTSYPKLKREMVITVEELARIALPDGLTKVEREAFAGNSFQRVDANAALESIGSRAFANCKELKLISLGGSVKEIAEDAFEGCADVAFLCPAGSYAASYAQEHNMVWSDSGEE